MTNTNNSVLTEADALRMVSGFTGRNCPAELNAAFAKCMVASFNPDADFVEPPKGSEIYRLCMMLHASRLQYAVDNKNSGWIVEYLDENGDRISDAICSPYSYGGPSGLLEICGLVDAEAVGDIVEGGLTAEQVFARWVSHYVSTDSPSDDEDEDEDEDEDDVMKVVKDLVIELGKTVTAAEAALDAGEGDEFNRLIKKAYNIAVEANNILISNL